MPGVPSGRACDACRKQKKKCDEVKPTCSRCRRLKIDCIGSGERRYKFEIHTDRSYPRHAERPGQSESRLIDTQQSQQIARYPSNAHTMLLQNFTTRVKFFQDTDLRYSLTWAYGFFLLQVPRRLGTNAALDAAADALVTSYSRFTTAQPDATVQELSKYSHALVALRETLNDIEFARDPSTLCAIMILLICQNFIGRREKQFTGHCEGAAQIIKVKGPRYKPQDDFERILMLTLRGPVLFEGLLNPKIRFTYSEWVTLIESELEATEGAGKMLCHLARIPGIACQYRELGQHRRESQLAELRASAKDVHDSVVPILDTLRTVYLSPSATLQNPALHSQAYIILANDQRVYGLALFIVAFANRFLKILDPTQDATALDAEASKLANEIITLGEEVRCLRPLGSAYMLICLAIAWSCASDSAAHEAIVLLWNDYASDLPATRRVKLDSYGQHCFQLMLA